MHTVHTVHTTVHTAVHTRNLVMPKGVATVHTVHTETKKLKKDRRAKEKQWRCAVLPNAFQK